MQGLRPNGLSVNLLSVHVGFKNSTSEITPMFTRKYTEKRLAERLARWGHALPAGSSGTAGRGRQARGRPLSPLRAGHAREAAAAVHGASAHDGRAGSACRSLGVKGS